jgi:hypothetical protein
MTATGERLSSGTATDRATAASDRGGRDDDARGEASAVGAAAQGARCAGGWRERRGVRVGGARLSGRRMRRGRDGI